MLKNRQAFLLVLQLTLVVLALLSCNENAVETDAADAVARKPLPEPELCRHVERFYLDGLGITPAEIVAEIWDEENLSCRFRVWHEGGLDESLTVVDAVTGIVKRYSTESAYERYAASIIREHYPEKYEEYVQWKKAVREEEKAEQDKDAARAREALSSYRSRFKPKPPWSCFGSSRQDQSHQEAVSTIDVAKSQAMQADIDERKKHREQLEQERREWEELLEWKPEYEKVSKEEAFNRMVPVLALFGQPTNLDRYSLCQGRGFAGAPSWHLKTNFEYQGVPFRGKKLHIEVSTYSGQIVILYHEPITRVPNPVSSPITKEKAIQIASKSMRKNEFFKWRLFPKGQLHEVDYDVDLDTVTKWIALPEESFGMSRREKATIKDLSPTQPRYCWWVPFKCTMIRSYGRDIPKDERAPSLYIIYVDMETGNVIRSEPVMPFSPVCL